MLELEDNIVKLTRGDTAYLTVPITNETTKETYTMAEGDTLTMSCKRRLTDTQYTFQKEVVGNNTFTLQPSDTNGAEFGNHIYDVQLTTASGEVFTVIPPTTFVIMTEVSVHD